MRLIIIFICIVLWSCNEKTDSLKKQAQMPVPKGVLCDIIYTVPDNWTIDDSSWPILICEPLKDNRDDFNECIVIDKLKLDSAYLDIFKIAEQLKRDSQFQDQGLIQTYYGMDSTQRMPCFKYTYQSLLNNKNNDRAEVNNYIFIKNNLGYIVSTRTLVNNKSKFDTLFLRFIQSIE